MNRHIDILKSHYRGHHLLITMGCDFTYGNAHWNFKSLDALIKAFNSRYDNVTLIYSTPNTYLDALNKENIVWPTKYDDMFPYADEPTCYWGGYFTSRANDKGFIRKGSHNLMASSKLYAL